MKTVAAFLFGVIAVGMVVQALSGQVVLTSMGYGIGCSLLAAASIGWMIESGHDS